MNVDQLSWIKEQFVRCTIIAQAAGFDFTIEIYVTQLSTSSDAGDAPESLAYAAGTATPLSSDHDIEKTTGDTSSDDNEKWTIEKLSLELIGATAHHGRPDVAAIMTERVHQSSGRTFVVGEPLSRFLGLFSISDFRK